MPNREGRTCDLAQRRINDIKTIVYTQTLNEILHSLSMTIQTHFLNATGVFNAHQSQIQQSIDDAFSRIQKVLPAVSEIDVIVQSHPNSAIPEIGIGGYSPDGNTIFLSFDLAHANIEKAIQHEIIKTLAHEVHHCMRRRGPGYGETLFEALITEGLADHFEMEVTHGTPPLWASALTTQELELMEKMAEEEYWRAYSHNDWFFGSKDKKIPRWAGYTLGFTLVKRYLDQTKERSAQLYNKPAREMFERMQNFT